MAYYFSSLSSVTSSVTSSLKNRLLILGTIAYGFISPAVTPTAAYAQQLKSQQPQISSQAQNYMLYTIKGTVDEGEKIRLPRNLNETLKSRISVKTDVLPRNLEQRLFNASPDTKSGIAAAYNILKSHNAAGEYGTSIIDDAHSADMRPDTKYIDDALGLSVGVLQSNNLYTGFFIGPSAKFPEPDRLNSAGINELLSQNYRVIYRNESVISATANSMPISAFEDYQKNNPAERQKYMNMLFSVFGGEAEVHYGNKLNKVTLSYSDVEKLFDNLISNSNPILREIFTQARQTPKGRVIELGWTQSVPGQYMIQADTNGRYIYLNGQTCNVHLASTDNTTGSTVSYGLKIMTKSASLQQLATFDSIARLVAEDYQKGQKEKDQKLQKKPDAAVLEPLPTVEQPKHPIRRKPISPASTPQTPPRVPSEPAPSQQASQQAIQPIVRIVYGVDLGKYGISNNQINQNLSNIARLGVKLENVGSGKNQRVGAYAPLGHAAFPAQRSGYTSIDLIVIAADNTGDKNIANIRIDSNPSILGAVQPLVASNRQPDAIVHQLPQWLIEQLDLPSGMQYSVWKFSDVRLPHNRERADVRKGIPLLGSVPFLGNVFSYNTSRQIPIAAEYAVSAKVQDTQTNDSRALNQLIVTPHLFIKEGDKLGAEAFKALLLWHLIEQLTSAGPSPSAGTSPPAPGLTGGQIGGNSFGGAGLSGGQN